MKVSKPLAILAVFPSLAAYMTSFYYHVLGSAQFWCLWICSLCEFKTWTKPKTSPFCFFFPLRNKGVMRHLRRLRSRTRQAAWGKDSPDMKLPWIQQADMRQMRSQRSKLSRGKRDFYRDVLNLSPAKWKTCTDAVSSVLLFTINT